MLDLIIAEKARLHLIDIGEYTEQKWGRSQREKYLGSLLDRMYFLTENPMNGNKREDIKTGYYAYNEGRHIIFYTYSNTDLEVVAVLHERMDFERHL